MTAPVRIEPEAEAGVCRWVASERAAEIQPRVREVFGGSHRLVFAPHLGIVRVVGPEPLRERPQFALANPVDAVDPGYLGSDLSHASTVTAEPSGGER